jgi:cobalamin biosynthesis Mg chelatase CobN
MLEQGYDGAREIMKKIEYVLGNAALTRAVAE